MLSKSAAKTFFLGGTALCSVALVLLTIDTVGRVPAQTHADRITPAVARGKDLWDSSNCMGCHTLMGEGAYYAPELTRVHSRRGDEFIRMMLRDPEAMFPNQRRMQRYDFSPQQIEDIVAFLTWVDGMDLNGFPAAPVLAAALPTAPNAPAAISGHVDLAGAPAVFGQLCTACHSIGGSGGNVGPALDGIADRKDPASLARWLRDPQAEKPGTAMPRLPLTDAHIQELVTWLSTMHSNNATGGTTP